MYTDLIFDLYGTLVDIHTEEDDTVWEKTAIYFGFYGAHYTAEELKAAGFKTLNAERKFDVTYEFYKQVREHNALTTYDTPMLLLHGELDDYVRIDDMLNFRRINEYCKLVIIPGADHQFHAPGAWDMVVDLTRDWFEFEQVLLCDWR